MLAAFLAVLFGTGIVSSVSAAPVMASASADIQQLYRLYGIGSKPVNHVLVVDGSLSMMDQAKYKVARKAVEAYLRKIGPQDKVSVIVFGKGATLFATGKGKSAVNIARRLPTPNPKTGMNTDIAAALDAAIAQVDRTPGDTQVVVLLTDGVDDPPAGTPFPRQGGRVWKMLAGRFKTAARGKDVFAFGVGLGEEGLQGATLVRKVVPGAESFAVAASALPGYFAGIREKVRRQQLTKALSADLKSGKIAVSVSAPERISVRKGEITLADVQIKNTFKHLPVEVSYQTAAKAGGWSGRTVLPMSSVASSGSGSRVEIQPGATKKVAMVMSGAKPDKPSSILIWPGSSDLAVNLDASAGGLAAYAAGIKSLGLDPAVAAQKAAGSTELVAKWGFPLWLAILIIALVVVVILLAIRRALVAGRPPKLTGSITVERDGAILATERVAGRALTVGGVEGPGTLAIEGLDEPSFALSARGSGRKKLVYVDVLRPFETEQYEPGFDEPSPAQSGPARPTMRMQLDGVTLVFNVRAQ